MKRAIKTHATDFAAILVLLVLSVAMAGYILSHERLRFPFIQSSPTIMKAEFSTAQAVTPGQGQTVRVSGVEIGQIGQVSLKNGIATVEMDINDKYKHMMHTDATALLRPRTGLKDMFIELNPGTRSAPFAKPGFTIPVSNTLPDINVDEILSSLDGDTRAYLDLLVNGAGQGLKGHGNQLAQVLQRFEPTHRDLARLNRAVAARGTNLTRLVNSLQRLNTALAVKQTQIVRLVDSSSTVFRAFASQDQNISRAIGDLPGTLAQTTATLTKVQTFANQLGPAATNLLPAARSLPAANQALSALAVPSTPIIKNQIRPFVIAARPVVRQLKPASVNLAKATPSLSKVFGVLNHFVNMVGYNPGGAQHGYLWWLAWLNHSARTLFSVQDANGVFRPLFLQASCATLAQIVNSVTGSETILNLTPILTSTTLCPKQAAADISAYRSYQQGKTTSSSATPRSAGGSGGTTSSGASGLFLPKLPTK
ncbi:MAG: phospholipid/cholesterol/gamma-HCH transport system substrate-binding protein [Solirubrobacteraceae bacterium]|nr:phospholipid/cholesterol/gamma-HCH transport system substrate-binding protein [Solirubrobacteraceae bacterium]